MTVSARYLYYCILSENSSTGRRLFLEPRTPHCEPLLRARELRPWRVAVQGGSAASFGEVHGRRNTPADCATMSAGAAA
eukprot:2922999-Rhodomonas_salina.4